MVKPKKGTTMETIGSCLRVSPFSRSVACSHLCGDAAEHACRYPIMMRISERPTMNLQVDPSALIATALPRTGLDPRVKGNQCRIV